MILIADSGPLLHLVWVNALEWGLPSQDIVVVETVWQEVERYAPEALQVKQTCCFSVTIKKREKRASIFLCRLPAQ